MSLNRLGQPFFEPVHCEVGVDFTTRKENSRYLSLGAALLSVASICLVLAFGTAIIVVGIPHVFLESPSQPQQQVLRLNSLSEQDFSSFNESDLKFSPVSAHKILYYPEKVTRNSGIPEFPKDLDVCGFGRDTDLEHHRGVDILKNGLSIKYAGVYYVYVSILFRPQSNLPCNHFKYQIFATYVQKISSRQPGAQTILRMAHTCCDNCVKIEETRFTGGLFILKPNDVIRVKVVGFDLVYLGTQSSFIGLALLGSPDSDSSGPLS